MLLLVTGATGKVGSNLIIASACGIALERHKDTGSVS